MTRTIFVGLSTSGLVAFSCHLCCYFLFCIITCPLFSDTHLLPFCFLLLWLSALPWYVPPVSNQPFPPCVFSLYTSCYLIEFVTVPWVKCSSIFFVHESLLIYWPCLCLWTVCLDSAFLCTNLFLDWMLWTNHLVLSRACESFVSHCITLLTVQIWSLDAYLSITMVIYTKTLPTSKLMSQSKHVCRTSLKIGKDQIKSHQKSTKLSRKRKPAPLPATSPWKYWLTWNQPMLQKCWGTLVYRRGWEPKTIHERLYTVYNNKQNKY